MSFDKVANCLFVVFVALASGMPQSEDATAKEKSGPLPFIQFTNGGIRLNFGGYHAEAGLGGFLRNPGKGGGLHASVGTPWGSHAGAGLGGGLGEDGRIGGGMYARAGAAYGGPEAEAGLGGQLDGSGRSLNPISGSMYAGATPGGGPGNGVRVGGGFGREEFDPFIGAASHEAGTTPPAAGSSSSLSEDGATDRTNATASGKKPSRGRTNIQIIRSRKKEPQPDKEKAHEGVAPPPADASAGERAESRVNEIRRAAPPHAAALDALGEFSTVTRVVAAPPPAGSVEKSEPAPAAPAAARVNVSADAVAGTDDNRSTVAAVPAHPRWHFRKRFWSAPRKAVHVAQTDAQGASSDALGNDRAATAIGKAQASGSLFDDIFNIPISTLAAVNQLLNNVG